MIYFMQIAGMFLIPFIAVLVPILIGQRYGTNTRKKPGELPHTPVGSVVGAAFGLLAFMLAFTFQIAANRYDARRQLLLEEVTQIRTAYLRAGLIPEPYRSNTKKLLVEYVDLRVGNLADRSVLNHVFIRSQQILDSLWKYAEALAEQDRSSEVYALYITTVNEMVDAYNQRIAMGLQYRIPASVLFVLFIITFLSMLILGYQFGISGKSNLKINLLLAIIFAVAMFLIIALDRPELGISRLSQKPMHNLQEQLHGKQLNVDRIIP
ncbi:MAG TPA: hypothetical protein VIZ28_11650 [Chitinophagaceae bacterium]